MSRSDDNVLARWSRRKRAAKAESGSDEGATSLPSGREAKALVPPPSPATGEGDHAHHAGGGRSSSADALPSPPPPHSGVPLARDAGEEPAEVDTRETAEPLPRVEDLTPESDLSAFLRKGVPEALKQAALRRMWSLDPAIRDYVGPAEYAWNFNDPGAMAGFGSAGGGAAIGKGLPSFSEGLSRETEERLAGSVIPSAEAEDPRPDTLDSVRDVPRSADRDPDSSDPPAGASGPESDADAGPPSRTAEEPGEVERPPHPPRHGGALPR